MNLGILRGEGLLNKDVSLSLKKKKKGISSSKKNWKLSDTGALNYQEEKCLVVGWEALESLS